MATLDPEGATVDEVSTSGKKAGGGAMVKGDATTLSGVVEGLFFAVPAEPNPAKGTEKEGF